MSFDILYEDNHLIAVNKPAGSLSQGDITGDSPILEEVREYLKVKYKKPGNVFLGLIHRIDRPVSGVLIFARTTKALSRMNNLFAKRGVQKTYWALTAKTPPKKEDTLVNHMYKDSRKNQSFVCPSSKFGSKEAELSYKHILSLDKYNLLEVKPKTGRPHQIRVQLANIGCVIKGDLKYGAPRSNPDASISLHAYKLEFIHPVKKEPIVIKAIPNQDDALWKAAYQEAKKKGLD